MKTEANRVSMLLGPAYEIQLSMLSMLQEEVQDETAK